MDGSYIFVAGSIHIVRLSEKNTYIVYNRKFRKYSVFYERSICSYTASQVSCTPSFLKILMSTSESMTEVWA